MDTKTPILDTLSEEQRAKLMQELNGNGANTTVIDQRPVIKKDGVVIDLDDGETPQFSINVNQDTLSLGDYLKMTEGTMTERIKVLGTNVMIDGKKLSADDGFTFLCEIKMSSLEKLTAGVESALVGENTKN